MMNKTLVDDKLVEAYPSFLKPLTQSFINSGQFTPNSVKETYLLMVQFMVAEKIFTVTNKSCIFVENRPSQKLVVTWLKELFKWVEKDRFFVPDDLFGLPGDTDEFALRFLDKIETKWVLVDNGKLSPGMLALKEENTPVRFTAPDVQDFGRDTTPETVLALFNTIIEDPIFLTGASHNSSSITSILNNRLHYDTGIISGYQMKSLPLVENSFGTANKYFTVSKLFSPDAMKKENRKAFLSNNLGFLGTTGGLVGGAFLLNPQLGVVSLVSAGIAGAISSIIWGAQAFKQNFRVTFTAEGRLLHENLLAWERYLAQVPRYAQYNTKFSRSFRRKNMIQS